MGRPPKNKTMGATGAAGAKGTTQKDSTIQTMNAEKVNVRYMEPGTGCSSEELYKSITDKLMTMRNKLIENGNGAEEHKDKAEILKYELLTRAAAILDDHSKPKCDLRNIDDVRARTAVYLASCGETNTYPSMMGLAVHGFQMTAQNVKQYMKENPDSPTGKFLCEISDVFADVLTNASLQNRANVVQTIFQLKNHFGYTDKQEVTIVAPNNAEQNPEELYSEVESLPEG